MEEKMNKAQAETIQDKEHENVTPMDDALEKIVCFLDLLGFSSLMKTNIDMAEANMRCMQEAIKNEFFDSKAVEKNGIDHKGIACSEDIKKIADKKVKESLITTFEKIFTMSDSIVLVARKNDMALFVQQICHFVAKLTRHSLNNEGQFARRSEVYPLLFRGGFGIGKVNVANNVISIENGKLKNEGFNIFGMAYLEAVKYEGTAPGPRIFCDKIFAENLRNQLSDHEKAVVSKVTDAYEDKQDMYEIVWPYYAIETDHFTLSNPDEDCDAVGINVKRAEKKLKKPVEELTRKEFYTMQHKVQLLMEQMQHTMEHYKAFENIVNKGIDIYKNS